MENNLWPAFDDILPIRTPKNILIEQGNFLEKNSKNLLKALIHTSNTTAASIQDSISHSFAITAPLLGNYSIHLLSVRHEIMMYPAFIKSSFFSEDPSQLNEYTANNEEELLIHLKTIFNSQRLVDIIRKIIGQIQAENQANDRFKI
jgi:hypothetical protein